MHGSARELLGDALWLEQVECIGGCCVCPLGALQECMDGCGITPVRALSPL